MTATDKAKPNEPAEGENSATGTPKAPSDGAKPVVPASDAKSDSGAKPEAGAKPAATDKPSTEPAKAATPAKPSAGSKPAAPIKPSAEAKPAAPAKPAVADRSPAKATGTSDDTTKTVPAAKPAATAAASAADKPAAAVAKDKDATPTKVDGERIDVLASDADAPEDDVPGKDAAARRADKDAPTVPPKRRWDRWYWVVGRGFATAVIGVAAIMLGVFVLPKFVDTTVSSSQGPQSPFSSGPDIPGSVPGGDQTGSPTPGTTFPTPNGPVQTQAGRPADALGAWAVNLNKLGIPQVALQAYGYAESVLAKTQPGCHLSWTLLAGIGSIESNHGRHGNATLQADGTSQPKIVGIQLSGATTERITDSDQGKLDGDAQYDRAMGAMQFIPTTWTKWAIDADNDGKADPYDLDDAAVSSAYYLCAGGRDLATAQGWWSAVLSYNNLTSYATSVYTAADNYGVQSTQ